MFSEIFPIDEIYDTIFAQPKRRRVKKLSFQHKFDFIKLFRRFNTIFRFAMRALCIPKIVSISMITVQ